ncbi:MAG: hypothetical protein ACRC28_18895 [Clostridium sp.]|uniref:hypothetical protein n=1 Tax=Clostridium sp. TaxID=1506 RepID=UPI003F2F5C73
MTSYGTTRKVLIKKHLVEKHNIYKDLNENKKEYENYLKYSKLGVLAKVEKFENNIIVMERVKPFLEHYYEKEWEDIMRMNNNCYMDDLLRNEHLEKELRYGDIRDILMKTDLDWNEWQVPSNWGIDSNNKLVLLDYSR